MIKKGNVKKAEKGEALLPFLLVVLIRSGPIKEIVNSEIYLCSMFFKTDSVLSLWLTKKKEVFMSTDHSWALPVGIA
jgi:hypothetical protein